ncbi:MAG TPA: non-canonical purine NTP pyrophosphatase [Candidatus Saccharimonadales bacterium]|nr:non-canonical purine NTP pyrophosphatase [Candidatus Saccharimonadales bacterium]
MKELIFATTNNGKVVSLQAHLDRAGCDIIVIAKQLEITEIQADTALEIAKVKAVEAFKQLGHPVVVDDSEFCIEALGGFPGPYQKYMGKKIGAEGLVKLMQGYDNRRAYFISNLVFVDENGEQYAFSDEPYWGMIADAVDEVERPEAWGPLWRVFIPEGRSVTLSQSRPEEHHQMNDKRSAKGAYKKFALWLKEREDA